MLLYVLGIVLLLLVIVNFSHDWYMTGEQIRSLYDADSPADNRPN